MSKSDIENEKILRKMQLLMLKDVVISFKDKGLIETKIENGKLWFTVNEQDITEKERRQMEIMKRLAKDVKSQ